MTFRLHPNLITKKFIIDLPLCRVLLEDNHYYPWLFLVPRRKNIAKIMDLKPSDQLQLIKETDCAQKVLWTIFEPTQLNVAAIGNKTPQLHIHVIARYSDDPAWPGTVWDHSAVAPYTLGQKDKVVQQLIRAFEATSVPLIKPV
jgi:diadenosine tetraphosphate (Ap4A) HIT family hydrolase